MSILFTGDLQAEWNNLHLCDKALDEILQIAKEKRVLVIVFLGDGKENYNPVDIRVIKWWQKAIRKAKQRGISILYLLGNHDRVGQYTDADNWLSILRRAGAVTFDVPGIANVSGRRLFMLPFSGMATCRKNARELLRKHPRKDKDILCFHQDIKGARYNNLGGESNAGMDVTELGCNRYKFAIGSHLHKPQKLGKNTYYVGSPFCQDWGEVNQRKRYIVVRGDKVESIRSDIPRWYDPHVAGFRESRPESWRGARLRINVPCDGSQDYGKRIDSVRRKAEKRYKGADIYVIPKFTDTGAAAVEGIQATDSDERKIREYIKQNQKPGFSRSLVLKYMLRKLSHFAGGLRTQSKVKLLSAEGENFLPFKHVKIDFTKKGITVIQGVNQDRGGKSNGSGKTSIVQIPPVALFGRTFKDQTHDNWANKHRPTEAAIAKLKMETERGLIKVIRGRRPTLLQLYLNGKDQSSGMKSTDKKGTQSLIEQITGFTWKTLANAVYIDRSVALAFLAGTKKERTEVLSKFQNLERFEEALKLVRDDEKTNRKNIESVEKKLSHVRGAIEGSENSYHQLKELQKAQIKEANKAKEAAKKAVKVWVKHNQPIVSKLEKKAERLRDDYKWENNRYQKACEVLSSIDTRMKLIKDQYNDWDKLRKVEMCPTCYQSVSKGWISRHSKKIEKKRNKFERKYNSALKKRTVLAKKVVGLESDSDSVQIELGRLEKNLQHLTAVANTTEEQYRDLFNRQHSAQLIVYQEKKRLKKLVSKKAKLKSKLQALKDKGRMYEYVDTAFSREGIPSFLNRQLCPILNKASDYYAELFSNSEIQVRFVMDEGEFVPQVINAKGGTTIDDQSEGEKALAGLIASFALREAAPKCNVLILDEPGDGLDSQTARQFARSLNKLKERFGSIFICTHNPVIAAQLSGERMLTVEKSNKISRVKEAA